MAENVWKYKQLVFFVAFCVEKIMFVLNITPKIEKVLIQCSVWLPVHVLRKFGGWAQLWVCITKRWTGAAVAAAGWSHETNSAQCSTAN